ncbi:ATP-binding protein [Desulforhopalus sp. IMCC35007]|uniref:ATP-binding protein n=1 Tax=Desulforhopalus sp. IMCC35007 TaxID=2569543 RepID=UPI0010AE6E97|nr:ATP-binding protein [Desulforhopalus sp. IMCC35007]TKB09692.1 response regulator [Desulforhopalus sp. IMCC35007]
MMDHNKKLQPDAAQARALLRKKAEATLRDQKAVLPEQQDKISAEEIQRKLHELQVHQIELEMQNDELRRAQAELAAARIRYFELYDLAPVGYCTLNEDSVILEANLSVATLLGVTKKALLRQPITRYILGDDQDIYYLHQKRLFETEAPQVCELRMVKHPGIPCWVRLNANLASDEAGAPGCRIVLSDITERKKIEEEKAKIEAQFQQAQKMESVGRLAGGVAHDFNNKLAIILGFVDIIMEQIDRFDPMYADLEEIRHAAKHSAVLTRQLLAFALKQPIVPIILDVNETVTGLIHMLVRLIGEDINFTWLPQTDLWPVKMDPSQLDQILTNLCVNARDAIAGNGSITIKSRNTIVDEVYCTTHPGSNPGEYVELSITDDGCGMSTGILGKIFEPFFTTKSVHEGTGLGLATVYGAILQNNGNIYVESDPGVGTTFTIHLPRYKEKSIEPEKEKLIEPAQHGTETILVVEDEQNILEMMKRMLQQFGYQILAADRPSEAVRLANKYRGTIDLLITDLIMPEMNGKDLAANILSFSPQLKTLYMSGYSSNIISQQGKIDSSIHFLQKPFSKNELGDKVRKVLHS